MRVLKLFGPPGTGKTETLLRVVEKAMGAGVRAERIAYITFTVRAQREAVSRASRMLQRRAKELPYFRTLHSIAYRQLGVTRSRLVLGANELAPLAKALHLEFSRSVSVDGPPERVSENDGDAFLAFDHYRRHTGLTLEKAWQRWALESDATIFRVRQFVKEYEAFKRREGLLDFTDLLEADLQPLPVDVLIVDEAQDLSQLQWAALRKLSVNAKRAYLAGDDDQAIYTWAGASPDEFLAARADRTQVLRRSHRLPRRVWALATELAEGIKRRQPKTWAPRPEEGSVRHAPDLDHALAQAVGEERDTLVLYRNHVFGRQVEETLRTLGTPYSYADPDRVPSARAWIPAIRAWEQLRAGKAVPQLDAAAVAEAIAVGKGASETTRQQLAAVPSGHTVTLDELRMIGISSQGPWYDSLTRVNPGDATYLRAILRHHGNDGLLKAPRVRISTIHAAKGAQADHVLLLTDMTRRVAKSIDENPDDERRVWYVGATRARQQLTIVGHDHPLFHA